MTRAELNRILARNPQLRAYENPSGRPLQPSQPEPITGPALGSSLPRSDQSMARISVCFISYCIRPKDPDNFAGSCKALLDGLRHAQLISDDAPWAITISFEQEKVTRRKDQRLEILLSIP